MRINNNIIFINTLKRFEKNTQIESKSIEKLSSGERISRARDGASGLAISERMRGQIRGLNQASKNIQDGISIIQTAESALTISNEILDRMKELAVQSANVINTYEDRVTIQNELDELVSGLNLIATSTEFNTQKLLDGTYKGTFQIGANGNQDIILEICALDADNLFKTNGEVSELDIITDSGLSKALSLISQAIGKVSGERTKLGAIQNSLEHALENNHNSYENLSCSESRIRDADMAIEFVNKTKSSILSQTAQVLLAQSNQSPEGVLQLLR